LDDVDEQTRRVYRALAAPNSSDILAIRRFMGMCFAGAELEELLHVPVRSERVNANETATSKVL
jgi:hypothetical protein